MLNTQKRIKKIRKYYRFYQRERNIRDSFSGFFQKEATGGILLFFATITALVFANFPQLFDLNSIWEKELAISTGDFVQKMTLRGWINDGLMMIFFFVVSLEIKREIMVGELSSFRKSSLPIAAAVGGMLMPALIYYAFNVDSPATARGWGIPTATDIAFAIGILSVLGKRVPVSLKIFLTALAIADDLGAIIVIAVFYPVHAIHFDMLMIAAMVMATVFILNLLQIRYTLIYFITGLVLWFLILQSGIHATVSGILLAALIPARTRISGTKFYVHTGFLIRKFRKNYVENKTILANRECIDTINAMRTEITKVSSPMQKFESSLHSFSMYIIMPLFALANAGIVINFGAIDICSEVSLGIICGLIIGKPAGIFLFGLVMIKSGMSKFSDGMNYRLLLNAGIFAGIGFTMSMFVSNLAFEHQSYTDTAKIAILISSAIAGILGIAATLSAKKKRHNKKMFCP
ncbi:MAG: Na+/H+ antiporter NhaA [Prevotellaceae bacterium]|jgi:NhaA family Na+:H+ antiporter|nr:Na+/H+ antiporter NhaA [Prevotellaceae bacterium]